MSMDPAASPAPKQIQLLRPQRANDRPSLTRWLPGLHVLQHYDRAWLRHDIVAGLVLTTMLVPVGIAYAVASGVPGIYGLIRDDCPAVGIRSCRAEPHPRAGAGFLTRRSYPSCRSAAIGRRPDAGGGTRQCHGNSLRRRLHRAGIGNWVL